MCVFYAGRFNCQVVLLVAAHDKKNMKKPDHSDMFSKWNINIETPGTVLTIHAVTSLLFFNDLCKPITVYLYVRKKHPFASCPTAKHLTHLNTTKISGLFFRTPRPSALAKVSVPVGSIIPWSKQGIEDWTRTETFS